MKRRWDLAPLLEAARTTRTGLCRKTGASGGSVYEAAKNGLSDRMADRWAIACGLHPAMVWDGWIDAGLTPRDRQLVEHGWRPAWLWNEANTELDEEAA